MSLISFFPFSIFFLPVFSSLVYILTSSFFNIFVCICSVFIYFLSYLIMPLFCLFIGLRGRVFFSGPGYLYSIPQSPIITGTIRLFYVISRELVYLVGVLALCREAVGVFYSPSRMGKIRGPLNRFHARLSKSSLKHTIRFCGIFSKFKTENYCISFF